MVACSGEQALPVFSGEGEAEMFGWLEGVFEQDWRARRPPPGNSSRFSSDPARVWEGGARSLSGDGPNKRRQSGQRDSGAVHKLDSRYCSISLGVHHPTRRLVGPL